MMFLMMQVVVDIGPLGALQRVPLVGLRISRPDQ